MRAFSGRGRRRRRRKKSLKITRGGTVEFGEGEYDGGGGGKN